jgi:RNA polymerase sigma factor (sigma-70 family)
MFPETQWSMILQLRSSQERCVGLERLCTGYRVPVCAFLQRACSVTSQDAEDLTQEFLAWLLTASVLDRYEPAQGSFRSYLKGVLRNFVRNRRAAARAAKRGGGHTPVSLSALPQEPAGEWGDPERAFDLAWAEALVTRASARVLQELRDTGRGRDEKIFIAYELAEPGTRPTYASVAQSVGVSENVVRHQLFRVRERIRTEIRADLRQTVTRADELELEWSALFALVSAKD